MWAVAYSGRVLERWDTRPLAAAGAVERYRQHLAENLDLVVAAWRELAGRNLSCWCPVDQPCHRAVLLQLANGPRPFTAHEVMEATADWRRYVRPTVPA